MPRKQKKPVIGQIQERCPYCSGGSIVRKGQREKKLEIVQLWHCNDCKKVFTPQLVKGKTFPLSVIFDGLSYYNLGYQLEESCNLMMISATLYHRQVYESVSKFSIFNDKLSMNFQ